MKIAAIDGGTNTLRLLIVDIEGTRVLPLVRERVITGLGNNLAHTGRLGGEGIESTLNAFCLFGKRMRDLGVERYFATGTEAFREGGNSGVLTGKIEDSSGIRISIISPGDEAALTRAGILFSLGGELVRRSIIIDIGGGSTEFLKGAKGGMSISTKLGVITLTDLFPMEDPPLEWERENLRFYIMDRLKKVGRELGVTRVSRIVGTAGTYTTLAAIKRKLKRYAPEKINGVRFSAEDLKELEKRLLSLSSSGRLKISGMERGRERLIVPGLLIANAAMDLFHAKETVVSDGSLLEGIIENMRKKIIKGEKYVTP